MIALVNFIIIITASMMLYKYMKCGFKTHWVTIGLEKKSEDCFCCHIQYLHTSYTFGEPLVTDDSTTGIVKNNLRGRVR